MPSLCSDSLPALGRRPDAWATSTMNGKSDHGGWSSSHWASGRRAASASDSSVTRPCRAVAAALAGSSAPLRTDVRSAWCLANRPARPPRRPGRAAHGRGRGAPSAVRRRWHRVGQQRRRSRDRSARRSARPRSPRSGSPTLMPCRPSRNSRIVRSCALVRLLDHRDRLAAPAARLEEPEQHDALAQVAQVDVGADVARRCRAGARIRMVDHAAAGSGRSAARASAAAGTCSLRHRLQVARSGCRSRRPSTPSSRPRRAPCWRIRPARVPPGRSGGSSAGRSSMCGSMSMPSDAERSEQRRQAFVEQVVGRRLAALQRRQHAAHGGASSCRRPAGPLNSVLVPAPGRRRAGVELGAAGARPCSSTGRWRCSAATRRGKTRQPAGVEAEVVLAAAELDAAHLDDAQAPALGAVLLVALLQADHAVRDAVQLQVARLRGCGRRAAARCSRGSRRTASAPAPGAGSAAGSAPAAASPTGCRTRRARADALDRAMTRAMVSPSSTSDGCRIDCSAVGVAGRLRSTSSNISMPSSDQPCDARHRRSSAAVSDSVM